MPDFIFATYRPQRPESVVSEAYKWIGKKVLVEEDPIQLPAAHSLHDDFLNVFGSHWYYKVPYAFVDKSYAKLGRPPFALIRAENLDFNNLKICLTPPSQLEEPRYERAKTV